MRHHPPSRTAPEVDQAHAPRTPLGRWLLHGPEPGEASHAHADAKPWWAVLWLTGVDYFSTLGYQPGIALLAAGVLSPLATLILVLVTLFGALPMYREVARRSYTGQGSIAILARLLTGWRSKLFVLILLGFAATGFVITMTLSAADAAKHLIENPLVAHRLEHGEVWVTLVFLTLLAIVFLRGLTEAIGLAVAVGAPYILLNIVVILRAAIEVAGRPELLSNWSAELAKLGSPVAVLLAACAIFPKLALGLSGFETGVSVMPVVRGDDDDAAKATPEGRIRGTRKLLAAAALMMSVLLIGSSIVSTLLVPKEAYEAHGPASGRVLAYLAHELMGPVFGTLYDISTILILWFAGSSAMTGLLTLIPLYLPRLGMAPRWVAYPRPLILLLSAINIGVTLYFRADVEAQGGAYATGVLALMLSAAVAVTLSLWQEAHAASSGRFPISALYYGLVSLVFIYTLIVNVVERPEGVAIAAVFIAAIIGLSVMSRYQRRTELRVERVVFADAESEATWNELVGKKINLVPLKFNDPKSIARKRREIRQHYSVDGPLAFLHVYLHDDRSDFASELRVKVRRLDDEVYIEATGAVALANTIAYLSELLDPIRIFLGLTRQNSVSQAFRYLIYGEGETGILVYEILLRHWEATPEEDVRPLIFLMSE